MVELESVESKRKKVFGALLVSNSVLMGSFVVSQLSREAAPIANFVFALFIPPTIILAYRMHRIDMMIKELENNVKK